MRPLHIIEEDKFQKLSQILKNAASGDDNSMILAKKLIEHLIKDIK